MAKSAIFFGSIGSMAETSEIQRRAYNRAMRETGLPWEWDEDTYRELLKQSGGRERLQILAKATNTDLSEQQIEEIHRRKTEIACEEVASSPDVLRPGVAELVNEAKRRGMKLGLVTSTYKPNVDAILEAVKSSFSRDDFDVIITREEIENGKPAPDAWQKAVKILGLKPNQVIAIEDSEPSIRSAKRAGIQVIAFPGRYTSSQDHWDADDVVNDTADANALNETVARHLQ